MVTRTPFSVIRALPVLFQLIKNTFCVRLIRYCFILVYACTGMWRHVVRRVHRSHRVNGSVGGNSSSQIETLSRYLPQRTNEKYGRTTGQHISRVEFEGGISQTQVWSLTTTLSCSCHENINCVSVTAITSASFWRLSAIFDFQLQMAGGMREVRWWRNKQGISWNEMRYDEVTNINRLVYGTSETSRQFWNVVLERDGEISYTDHGRNEEVQWCW
jgi:hypothetical protein